MKKQKISREEIIGWDQAAAIWPSLSTEFKTETLYLVVNAFGNPSLFHLDSEGMPLKFVMGTTLKYKFEYISTAETAKILPKIEKAKKKHQ